MAAARLHPVIDVTPTTIDMQIICKVSQLRPIDTTVIDWLSDVNLAVIRVHNYAAVVDAKRRRGIY